jgi:hypothetical protein
VAAPDPVDVRLLTTVAETGRAAVHEIAARLGMDVRDVAARLAALSTTGLPLVVGAECDPQGIHNALAAAGIRQQPVGPYRGYPQNDPPPGYNNGPYPAQTGPSGPYPAQTGPSGPQQFPPPGPPGSYAPAGHYAPGPYPPQRAAPTPAQTWGPPGSASWARGDQEPTLAAPQPQPTPRSGKIGSTLEATGLSGEQITIQLVEVVDPADFLFTAAGHELQAGHRAVVVHTELTNRGSIPFATLPDLCLLLVTVDGSTISKAPMSLSSRPPHRAGLSPGETTGGHTIYVLPENTDLVAVRWTPAPGATQHALSWDIVEN